MQRILVIGFGDVARRLAPLLVGRFRVYGLYRRKEQVAEMRALGVVPVAGDLDDFRSLQRIRGLADWVIHLAPPPAHGAGDPRTRRLLACLANRSSRSNKVSARRLVYISTSGVYGDAQGDWVPETRKPAPRNARGQRRLTAERLVRATARDGVTASILRVPGIYALERLPVERLSRGTPAIQSAEDSLSNHIHADDLALITLAALFRGRPGRTINAADDEPQAMGEYFDLVADWAGLSRPPRISREEAERSLPESLLSFMRESRRLDNRRLKKELKVRLRYPTVRSFLEQHPRR